ncbi:MAG: serine hydrolase [Phenylobacterium sp.]|uniref:serine hydrolase n=1 Tax=Phenylobacterium sp. TaxID=1871053 RepID=UPI0025E4EC22|nr:serine hydrolase [Phenylobacterium sp.]MBI1197342.1 serine hydrolase [Phenylobacterium sp.]
MDITRRAVTPGLLAILAGAASPSRADTPAWRVPDDAAIAKILADRIDVQKQGVGLVVGVIDAAGRRIITHGALAKDDPRPLGGDTLFEIGSMTKVFTGLLLADMARRGEVKLDDPAAKYLPDGVHVPERDGRQITLVDLATQTSGLPRMPTNFAPKDPLNPFADYTVDQLYPFLGGYVLTRDIGSKYEYSNVGMGLLGHVLARRAGTDYETLVRRRITGPLGMTDTAITLTPDQKARMATGHTEDHQPTPAWDLPTLAGAGALRSTADDLLVFLAAELGFAPSPLKPAMDAQLAVRRSASPMMDVALAWHILKTPAGEIVWHNGGTGGFRTFFGFDPKAKVGVVVLANLSNLIGADDIGFHLLTGRPLAVLKPPGPARRAITLPADQLAGLAGRYRFATGAAVLTVTLRDGRLFAELSGQAAYEIYPESRDEFFYKVVDAQLSFARGADGRATSVTLHQNGHDQAAGRIEP